MLTNFLNLGLTFCCFYRVNSRFFCGIFPPGCFHGWPNSPEKIINRLKTCSWRGHQLSGDELVEAWGPQIRLRLAHFLGVRRGSFCRIEAWAGKSRWSPASPKFFGYPAVELPHFAGPLNEGPETPIYGRSHKRAFPHRVLGSKKVDFFSTRTKIFALFLNSGPTFCYFS